MRPTEYQLGLTLITVSAVAWSTAGLFTRLIPLDSWTMLVWRGLFGAFGIAVVILALERRNAVASFQNMPVACMSALLSGLVCWPLGDSLAATGYELLLLALFGIVNSAVGLALFTLGARLLHAIETALIGSLDAPLAPLWVWFVFNETPSGSTKIGGAIVFVAVAAHVIAGASQMTKPSS